MKIENNVLMHYLKNVYFITGTAYAGKSTTVKMLAERYGLICCGENYHMAVSDEVATREPHPDLCYNKTLTDWREFVMRSPEEHYDEYANSGFFTVVREDNGTDTRKEVCDIIAKHFGLV